MQKTQEAHLMHSLIRLRKQMNMLLSSGQIPPGEYYVLRVIKHKDGCEENATPKAADLSNKLDLSRPAITRILNSLEAKGYVIRNINLRDRRSISIELTKKGEAALIEADAKISEISHKIWTSLGEKDGVELTNLLAKTSDAFGNLIKESEMTNEEKI